MSATGERTVLAIDPGQSKCGFALVNRSADGKVSLLWRKVAPTESLEETVAEAAEAGEYSMVVVGSGTRSQEVVGRLRDLVPGKGVLVVDEKLATALAEGRETQYGDTYFMTQPRFETGDPRYAWLNSTVAVSQGRVLPNAVEYRVYQVVNE